MERIAAGELFQANLCLRLEAAWDGDVAQLFAHAVGSLQPRYGACFPESGVASFSPELFLRRRGRTVVTGPIKGTAPSDPEALQRSLKDRAEHVMIVDLMRNDLGRVARYGTVKAQDAPTPLPHPGGWHLVSEVAAEVEATNEALLRATFPPGSVTGAPKVQAMHVIAALEATGREVYTGAIGFASANAGLELNVAIRTFEARNGRLWLGAGGGIVADSDPAAELEECLVKARPLIGAIGGRIVHQAPRRPTRFQAPLATGRRPDPARGVFETLLVRDGVPVNLEAHLDRLARSVRDVLRRDASGDRHPPGRTAPCASTTSPGSRRGSRPARSRPARYRSPSPRTRCQAASAPTSGATATCSTRSAGPAAARRRWHRARSRVGRRADPPRRPPLHTPQRRPHPAEHITPEAEEADLQLEDGDELFVSSSLAGLVPAVLLCGPTCSPSLSPYLQRSP